MQISSYIKNNFYKYKMLGNTPPKNAHKFEIPNLYTYLYWLSLKFL